MADSVGSAFDTSSENKNNITLDVCDPSRSSGNVTERPLVRARSSSPGPAGPSRKRHRSYSPSIANASSQANFEDSPRERESERGSSYKDQENKSDDIQSQSASIPGEERSNNASVNRTNGKDAVNSESRRGDQDEQVDDADPEIDDGEHEDPEEGELPPLPPGPPPDTQESSDGWEAVWEVSAGAYYFYNRFTRETTWTNPRVPPVSTDKQPDTYDSGTSSDQQPPARSHGGYDPSIHGDYDPTAPYAQRDKSPSPSGDQYTNQASFNRFTGNFNQQAFNTEQYSEENKSRKQMEYFFDVDAAANSHNGKSLKAERQAKKLTKKEVKAFKEKNRLKKEEKKRAWLRD